MFQASTQALASPHSQSPTVYDMVVGPEITFLSTGPNGERKARKMRASCDACSRAKVKCDKVRPTCHRCDTMSICCNYSPSMRLGKPRKNRNFDGSIKREISPAGSYAPLGVRMELLPLTASHTYESSPEPTDPFYFGPRTPEYHYQDAFVGNKFHDGHSSVCSDGISSHVNAWSNEEQIPFANQSEMFAPVRNYLPPTTFHRHFSSTRVPSQPEALNSLHPTQNSAAINHHRFDVPVTHDAQSERITASPSHTVSTPLPTPPASNIMSKHDCTQFAFQILCSLYVSPEAQSAAVEVNPLESLPASGSVLSTNVAAVDRLYTLLSCDCSSNPHFSTTITLTIMKILSWYQAIAGGNQQDEGYSIESYLDTTSHRHISQGVLDPEREQTRRTTLILAELCRIEKLVDRFSERYCNTANTVETGIDCGVYLAMEASLRIRVRDTFKTIMSVAPQNVKRQMASRTKSRLRVNTV